jgi:catechol 2,3-dioxygenase-like lactoylglutathione lyase family enzyme
MSVVFDHVGIHVSDLAASRAFYGEALGLPTNDGELPEWGDFGITGVSDEHPLTSRLHIAFGVEDRDAVDAWWNRLTEAGYGSDGEPGPRRQYSVSYYGGFILDPEGNSVEAVHHDPVRPGEIDHLWLCTRDVPAAKRFYETVASVVGIRKRHDSPDRVQFSDGDGSFSFVAGDQPTQNVHLAFGVPDVEAVAGSTKSRSPRAIATTARLGSGPSTTPATTERSYSMPTFTTSKPSSTTARASINESN